MDNSAEKILNESEAERIARIDARLARRRGMVHVGPIKACGSFIPVRDILPSVLNFLLGDDF